MAAASADGVVLAPERGKPEPITQCAVVLFFAKFWDKSSKLLITRHLFVPRAVPELSTSVLAGTKDGHVGGRAASEIGFGARFHGINAVAIRGEVT